MSDPNPNLSLEQMMRILRECGSLLDGHFLLSSGLHSPNYMQCALLLQYPKLAAEFCTQLAAGCVDLRAQVVCAPALGGILVGHEVARALDVRSLFTERREGVMELRRGFALAAGDRVLVAEDVITTGKSTRETIAVIEALGGQVVGVAALVSRSPSLNPFDVPFRYLLRLEFPTYDPDACPLCASGSQAVKPGSRVS